MTADQKKFIESIGSLVQRDKYADKILPSLTIAQAILESGWGKSSLTTRGKALFGIKAGSSWKGKVYSCKTQECYDGVNFTQETACFRAYDSLAESIADHGAFLCGLSRYKNVIGERDYKAACRAIHKAGYATDPTYADKLIKMIESYDLTKYDDDKHQPMYEHEVVSGDTMSKIATKYSVPIDDILSLNADRYPKMTKDHIEIGWKLQIPVKTYTVKSGDTMSSIAESCETTVEEIARKNPDLIQSGDILFV